MQFKSPWEDGNNQNPKKEFDSWLKNNNFDNKKIIGLGILVAVLFFIFSGIYQVKEGERSIVMRFGRIVRHGNSGLNFSVPILENRIITQVDKSRRLEIGYRSNEKDSGKYFLESTMVTRDENIIMVSLDVIYHIENLEKYIMNVSNPEETIKSVVESSLREVVSKVNAQAILSDGKQTAVEHTKHLAQAILDNYDIGAKIDMIQLLKAEPPFEVIGAYREVQVAKADKEKEINQAQAYRNDRMPKVKGEATKIISQAEAAKSRKVLETEGEVKRYNTLLEQFSKANKAGQDAIRYEMISEARVRALENSEELTIINSAVLPHMNVFNKQGPKSSEE